MPRWRKSRSNLLGLPPEDTGRAASLFVSLPLPDPSERFVSADESMAQNTPSIRADHRALSRSSAEDLSCTQPPLKVDAECSNLASASN